MDIKTSVKAEAAEPAASQKTKKLLAGFYIVISLAFLVFYFLLKQDVLGLSAKNQILLQKLSLGCFFAVLILFAAKLTEVLLSHKISSRSAHYNLFKAINLFSIILIIAVFVSFLFQNWYTAAVSLGLISLILGFALQTPILSFIGWLYIIIRNPYRVGDRIQLDSFTGDVVEINYLDTTLWEFGGDYLQNDLPSGRLIRFPNSLVLESPVFNYSWDKFPYIWNEIPFHVAYESNLDFVTSTIHEIAGKELGEETADRIKDYKKLVSQTPIDEFEINEYPYVSLRINTNTWVEVVVTYLTEPKHAARTRSKLIRKILEALLLHPEKVMFPNGNSR